MLNIHKDALEHDARDQQLYLNKKQVMKLFEGIAMRGEKVGSGSINSFLPIIQKVLYRHGHVRFEQSAWRPLDHINYVAKYIPDEKELKP